MPIHLYAEHFMVQQLNALQASDPMLELVSAYQTAAGMLESHPETLLDIDGATVKAAELAKRMREVMPQAPALMLPIDIKYGGKSLGMAIFILEKKKSFLHFHPDYMVTIYAQMMGEFSAAEQSVFDRIAEITRVPVERFSVGGCSIRTAIGATGDLIAVMDASLAKVNAEMKEILGR